MLQVVQLLKLEQNAQPATSHNWQTPWNKEYPDIQAEQEFIELGQDEQEGTLQALQIDPDKV